MQNPIIYALVIKSSAVLRRGKEGHIYFYSSIHTQHTSKCLTKAQKCYNISKGLDLGGLDASHGATNPKASVQEQ